MSSHFFKPVIEAGLFSCLFLFCACGPGLAPPSDINAARIPPVASETPTPTPTPTPPVVLGNPPTVVSVNPIIGLTAGGTALTITGTDFNLGVTVAVGGSSCTSLTRVNSTTLTCTTSAHSAGIVDLVVTNTDTQSASSPYTYSTGNFWVSTSTASAPSPRMNHTSIWTGSKIIIWGGMDSANTTLLTGSQFDPVTDSWSETNPSSTFSRVLHTAIWTGSKMLIWGGATQNYSVVFRSGSQYDPVADTWTDMSTVNVPTGAYFHTAVWTGSKMLTFGGISQGSSYQNEGGIYDPETDTWSRMTTLLAPTTRQYHSAVWDGSKMLIWGGGSRVNTGGIYDLYTNTWTRTSTLSAPAPRDLASAVWTGSEMIIFGGTIAGPVYVNTGGRYTPATNTWTVMPTLAAPSGRSNLFSTSVWNGFEMLTFGGFSASNIGGIYHPVSDTWEAMTTLNAPFARDRHRSVGVDSKIYIFGGYDTNTGGYYTPVSTDTSAPLITSLSLLRGESIGGDNLTIKGKYFTTGVVVEIDGLNCGTLNFVSETEINCLTPAHAMGNAHVVVRNLDGQTSTAANGFLYADSWTATTTTSAPSIRNLHSAVWTGSQMVIWGGWDGTTYVNTGGRFNPVTNSWSTTTTLASPQPRGSHSTAYFGGSSPTKMVVWGGYNGTNYLSTGGQYDASGDSWVATATAGAAGERARHQGVAADLKMVIWGGDDNTTTLNTIDVYDPYADTWIYSTAAFDQRSDFSAVWTGTTVIAFGGWDGNSYSNSLECYEPSTNQITCYNGTPLGRRYQHTAVWTGTKVILYGGSSDGTNSFNTGGSFDPDQTVWNDTATLNAPTPSAAHSAVWTGTKMIIFGGKNNGVGLNSGGEYNILTDSWMPLTTANAPEVRREHTGVWSGTRMLIFGGSEGSRLNTGGIYLPNGS